MLVTLMLEMEIYRADGLGLYDPDVTPIYQRHKASNTLPLN